ncbi:MAG: sigma-70 family RNA polymerase sigma factor [Bdellovibrionales bacterium]|nr:sigma-70 family RNA polymerase sigma factor [Bdellovibrionales bacterium]
MEDIRNDCELVAALKTGDKSAFVTLLGRYTEKVHNLALRITRSPEDAEEILQDVFLTVYNKIGAFEGKAAFSSWLYRITANTSFMKLRKRKQHAATSLEESITPDSSWASSRSDTSDVNFMSARHELRALLEEAIDNLPEEYRVIFIMRDVDGLSNQEVGEVLKISIPAVKSRLHRSRLMLRRKLNKYYEDYTRTDHIAYGKNIHYVEDFRQAA